MKKIFITIAIVLFVQTLYAQSDFILQAPFKSNYYISWTFGYYENYSTKKIELHEGIDFAVRTGTPVYAAAAGTVVKAGWSGGYGYLVVIDHGNGYQTYYAHNSRLCVSVGQSVSKGQNIAYSGSTGNSTGPHLHFEVRINGNTTNPLNYI